nr:sialic acid-binding Ig-like lectin 9 [Odocoileus virginianus texanus]
MNLPLDVSGALIPGELASRGTRSGSVLADADMVPLLLLLPLLWGASHPLRSLPSSDQLPFLRKADRTTRTVDSSAPVSSSLVLVSGPVFLHQEGGGARVRQPLAPPTHLSISHPDLNGTSLPILEGQFLRLVCVADSNPPARLSWLWEGKPLSPSQRSDPGVLEIPRVGVGDGGEVTCRAQHPLGSQQVSFSLSVQKGPPSCSCETEEPQGSWPLVVTLIRGALMGAGFLLTYGLTWTYYTRCAGHSGAGLRGVAAPRSLS